jgi:glutamate synthase (NADPH) large chain
VMPVEYRRALEEIARRQQADKAGLGDIEIGLRGNGK